MSTFPFLLSACNLALMYTDTQVTGVRAARTLGLRQGPEIMVRVLGLAWGILVGPFGGDSGPFLHACSLA